MGAARLEGTALCAGVMWGVGEIKEIESGQCCQTLVDGQLEEETRLM